MYKNQFFQSILSTSWFKKGLGRKYSLISSMAIFMCVALIAGCGQKGALFLQPELSPVPAKSYISSEQSSLPELNPASSSIPSRVPSASSPK